MNFRFFGRTILTNNLSHPEDSFLEQQITRKFPAALILLSSCFRLSSAVCLAQRCLEVGIFNDRVSFIS